MATLWDCTICYASCQQKCNPLSLCNSMLVDLGVCCSCSGLLSLDIPMLVQFFCSFKEGALCAAKQSGDTTCVVIVPQTTCQALLHRRGSITLAPRGSTCDSQVYVSPWFRLFGAIFSRHPFVTADTPEGPYDNHKQHSDGF